MTPKELSFQGVEGIPYEQDYTSPGQGVCGIHYKPEEIVITKFDACPAI